MIFLTSSVHCVEHVRQLHQSVCFQFGRRNIIIIFEYQLICRSYQQRSCVALLQFSFLEINGAKQ